ncbi:MAG TPA: hypothetical protein VM163_12205 [bacterium]|nr:hypothetical protein [bacterium]
MILNADLKAHMSRFYDDDYGQTGYGIAFWIMGEQMLTAWNLASQRIEGPDGGTCADLGVFYNGKWLLPRGNDQGPGWCN